MWDQGDMGVGVPCDSVFQQICIIRFSIATPSHSQSVVCTAYHFMYFCIWDLIRIALCAFQSAMIGKLLVYQFDRLIVCTSAWYCWCSERFWLSIDGYKGSIVVVSSGVYLCASHSTVLAEFHTLHWGVCNTVPRSRRQCPLVVLCSKVTGRAFWERSLVWFEMCSCSQARCCIILPQ